MLMADLILASQAWESEIINSEINHGF